MLLYIYLIGILSLVINYETKTELNSLINLKRNVCLKIHLFKKIYFELLFLYLIVAVMINHCGQ